MKAKLQAGEALRSNKILGSPSATRSRVDLADFFFRLFIFESAFALWALYPRVKTVEPCRVPLRWPLYQTQKAILKIALHLSLKASPYARLRVVISPADRSPADPAYLGMALGPHSAEEIGVSVGMNSPQNEFSAEAGYAYTAVCSIA